MRVALQRTLDQRLPSGVLNACSDLGHTGVRRRVAQRTNHRLQIAAQCLLGDTGCFLLRYLPQIGDLAGGAAKRLYRRTATSLHSAAHQHIFDAADDSFLCSAWALTIPKRRL